MTDVKELLAYILINYPFSSRNDLSKTRVTKLIYLCDWKSSIEYGRQITDIEWVFDNYGPFVWDVMSAVEEYPSLFEIRDSQTFFGSSKTLVSIVDKHYAPQLEVGEQKIADFVIRSTKSLRFDEFIKMIYATYPVMVSEKYSKLNLPKLAEAYKGTKVFKEINPDFVFN